MYEFKLPDVGEGIHEAEILTWRVSVGDTVTQDQPLLDIQTDKAIVEIPSPLSGAIAEIRARPGTIARVGDVLVVIAAEGESGESGRPASREAINGKAAGPPAGIDGPGRRVLASPAVRRLALALGVDLAQVAGSGPAGRVLPEDIGQAARQKSGPPQYQAPSEMGQRPGADTGGKPAPARAGKAPGEDNEVISPDVSRSLPPPPRPVEEVVEEEALQGLRRRIAERMELARQIPQVTSFDELDASRLMALRDQLQPEAERRGVHLTYLPLIVKAAVQALKEFPYFNASLDMERQKILLRRYYHLGIATAVPDGLVVPVIRHADRLTVLQLAAEIQRLAGQAQERKLSLEELSGSTFTITNFGSFGGQQGTPIINPPEVAILGCGRIEKKAVVVEDQVVARPVLPLALSFDHRLIDGAAAGQFLARLKALLADPNLLFLELV